MAQRRAAIQTGDLNCGVRSLYRIEIFRAGPRARRNRVPRASHSAGVPWFSLSGIFNPLPPWQPETPTACCSESLPAGGVGASWKSRTRRVVAGVGIPSDGVAIPLHQDLDLLLDVLRPSTTTPRGMWKSGEENHGDSAVPLSWNTPNEAVAWSSQPSTHVPVSCSQPPR